MLENPSILILDEATASVDPFTETRIQDALEKTIKDRTSIIIAHRLWTVRHVDRIIVLDHGKIAGIGEGLGTEDDLDLDSRLQKKRANVGRARRERRQLFGGLLGRLAQRGLRFEAHPLRTPLAVKRYHKRKRQRLVQSRDLGRVRRCGVGIERVSDRTNERLAFREAQYEFAGLGDVFLRPRDVGRKECKRRDREQGRGAPRAVSPARDCLTRQ